MIRRLHEEKEAPPHIPKRDGELSPFDPDDLEYAGTRLRWLIFRIRAIDMELKGDRCPVNTGMERDHCAQCQDDWVQGHAAGLSFEREACRKEASGLRSLRRQASKA